MKHCVGCSKKVIPSGFESALDFAIISTHIKVNAIPAINPKRKTSHLFIMSKFRVFEHKFRNLFLIEQKCIRKSSFRASEMSVGISLVVIKIKSGRLPRLVSSLAMTSFLIEQKMAAVNKCHQIILNSQFLILNFI